MKVFITDGLQRKSLSITRSLGREGIQVLVGEKSIFSPTGFSKYCNRRILYPDPVTHLQEYKDSIIEHIKKNKCDVFLPLDDTTLQIALDHRSEIESNCILPLPANESIATTSDKYKTMLLAMESGVPCPKTYMPTSVQEVINIGAKTNFPLVIKPRRSSGSRGIRIVHNNEEFIKQYNIVHEQFPNPLVQDYIPIGARYGVCLLYNHLHEVKAVFVQQEVRHFPIKIGPSTVQRSVENQQLVDMSIKLLSPLNWIGVVEIEFMVDSRDGVPKLMEVNPRFWNSLELSVQCGVNFPYLLYKVAQQEEFEISTTYEVGRMCRWLLPGDLFHFLTNKKRKKMSPPFFDGKKKRLYDDTFSLEDPLPGLLTIITCIRYAFNVKMWKSLISR